MSRKKYKDEDLLDPPMRDEVEVQFQGDRYATRYPLSEILDGIIIEIDDDKQKIMMQISVSDGEGAELKPYTYEQFVSALDASFNLKKITRVFLQQNGSYDEYCILS